MTTKFISKDIPLLWFVAFLTLWLVNAVLWHSLNDLFKPIAFLFVTYINSLGIAIGSPGVPHCFKFLADRLPLQLLMSLQIILIILKKFFNTCFRNINKFNLRFNWSWWNRASCPYILLSTPCSLNHLVFSPASTRNIVLKEIVCDLINHICLLITKIHFIVSLSRNQLTHNLYYKLRPLKTLRILGTLKTLKAKIYC